MKLAITTPFLRNFGGMERVVLDVARHYQADIYCMDYQPDKTFPEFEDIVIDQNKSFLSGIPPRRIGTAIDAGLFFHNTSFEGYDVINAHQTPAEWCANLNRNVLWQCYSPNREAYDLYEWRMKRRSLLQKALFWPSIAVYKHIASSAIPKVKHIVTTSHVVQSRIKEYFNRESDVIHPFIDASKFSNKPSEPFFFYPSRLVPEKDFEFAIEAFRLAKLPDWKLVIAGHSSDSKYLKYLQSLCNENIHVIPDISEEVLRDYYSRCTAVLFTPVNEDFGLVPLEAMASGKPCIAKDEGGPKETVDNGVDGFRASATYQMAEYIRTYASQPELAVAHGRNGLAKVKEKFTAERFFRQYDEALRKVII